MKLFLVYRNGNVDLDEYESAIVVAESPEAVIEMLKTSLEEMHGEGQEAMWGLFNSITEYENWGRMTKKPAEYSIVMGNRANTMAKAYNVITSYIQKQ